MILETEWLVVFIPGVISSHFTDEELTYFGPIFGHLETQNQSPNIEKIRN